MEAMEVLLINCLDQDMQLQKGQLVAMVELLELSCVMMMVTKVSQLDGIDCTKRQEDLQGGVSVIDIEESLNHCDLILHAHQVQELKELVLRYQHLFVHQLHCMMNEKVPEVHIDTGDSSLI